jgi:hypothetical protein
MRQIMYSAARQETIQFAGLQNALAGGYAITWRLPAKGMMEHEGLFDFKGAIYPTLNEHRNRSKQPCVNIPGEV